MRVSQGELRGDRMTLSPQTGAALMFALGAMMALNVLVPVVVVTWGRGKEM